MKIRIYDNGGKTIDRYTIVDMEPAMMVNHNTHNYVGASITGAGFYQHGEIKKEHLGSHLGKRVKFETLDPRLQSMIRNDFDHISNLYKNRSESDREQLLATITLDDNSVHEGVAMTIKNNEIDCYISFPSLNIWFRTKKGMNKGKYNTLSQLKTQIKRRINQCIDNVNDIEFSLTNNPHLFRYI